MTLSRICDMCHQGNETVRRYGLYYYIPRPDMPRRNDGRISTRQANAGGLDLCANCWERHAQPKTRAATSKYQRDLHPSVRGSRLQVSGAAQAKLGMTKRPDVRTL